MYPQDIIQALCVVVSTKAGKVNYLMTEIPSHQSLINSFLTQGDLAFVILIL